MRHLYRLRCKNTAEYLYRKRFFLFFNFDGPDIVLHNLPFTLLMR